MTIFRFCCSDAMILDICEVTLSISLVEVCSMFKRGVGVVESRRFGKIIHRRRHRLIHLINPSAQRLPKSTWWKVVKIKSSAHIIYDRKENASEEDEGRRLEVAATHVSSAHVPSTKVTTTITATVVATTITAAVVTSAITCIRHGLS
jgi:hypothetical protein